METREFILGTRQQQEWRWLVIEGLFLTGIGASLFILALIPGLVLGMAVGVILVLAVSLSLQADLSRRRAVLYLFA